MLGQSRATPHENALHSTLRRRGSHAALKQQMMPGHASLSRYSARPRRLPRARHPGPRTWYAGKTPCTLTERRWRHELDAAQAATVLVMPVHVPIFESCTEVLVLLRRHLGWVCSGCLGCRARCCCCSGWCRLRNRRRSFLHSLPSTGRLLSRRLGCCSWRCLLSRLQGASGGRKRAGRCTSVSLCPPHARAACLLRLWTALAPLPQACCSCIP